MNDRLKAKIVFNLMENSNVIDPVQSSNWNEVKAEKTVQIFEVLKGLNVYQAKKILESMIYHIESNAIVS